jgi:hypothetical protein
LCSGTEELYSFIIGLLTEISGLTKVFSFLVVVGSKVVAIWMALHQMDFLALGWQISQFPASLQELD